MVVRMPIAAVVMALAKTCWSLPMVSDVVDVIGTDYC